MEGYTEFDCQMQRLANLVNDSDGENKRIKLVEEYDELGLKVSELEDFITLYKNDDICVNLDCPLSVLEVQLYIMRKYKLILAERIAILDGIA